MSLRTVWVTGSSRGIGRAVAEQFARNGFRVVLHCLERTDLLTEVTVQLRSQNRDVMYTCGDISSDSDVKRMYSEIKNEFGPVDILVNNAGIALPEQLLTDCSAEQIDRILSVNCKGAMLCSKAVIPDMVSRKKGSIVNISSYLGITGCSCEVPYSASKAALIGLTRSLALELAPSGIRVNAVAPGFVDTEMNREFTENERQDIRANIPLERFGETGDIANAVYFLALEETAGFITGQILCVDGGSSL
ncbi:MAG: 3-oxoacyl-ACP reductase FabG [Clostridia bacterium]|nr:3-oxoacyl-ACP reductase FabG [Clostridia bacterium]